MKVLSLFDGMACGMLAMQKAGLQVERYVAFEIDKYAVQTSSHNFPMIEHRGDVFQADFTEFKGFDFLVGGSPCTYWSIAQKNNRETVASGMGWELFGQYVRALKEAQPMYFIYENNKSMSGAIRASIDQAFGFDAIGINSALVSAQNRQRLYWVGKRNMDGTYSKVHVEQPEDRSVFLCDVLDGFADQEKSYPLLCSIGRTTVREYYTKSQGVMALEPVGIGYRGRTENGKWVKRFESNGEQKANALTTCQNDSMVGIPIYEVKKGMITVKGKHFPIKLPDGFYIIRKPTVDECKRLQTVPEWYEFPVSNAQAYKMLGNGWTVDVIEHLISATQKDVKAEEQMDLFSMGV